MRLLLAMFCALLLPACAMTKSTFAPESSFSLDGDIADLRESYGLGTSLKDYYSKGESKDRRNELIAARLALYDLEYLRFVQTLRMGRAQADTLFDNGLLGLGLATTLVKGERTKTVLGSILTAVTGSRASFEKNFYADRTTGALVSQMNAERKAALVQLLQNVDQPIEQYPMSRAIIDLSAYQAAGTIDGALQGAQKDAAAKDAEQSAKIEKYRSGAFNPDDSSNRIMQWLYPGFVTFDKTGVAHTADGTVVDLVQANWDKLEDEIDRQGFGGLTVEAFLNDGAFTSARAEAIGKLSVP